MSLVISVSSVKSEAGLWPQDVGRGSNAESMSRRKAWGRPLSEQDAASAKSRERSSRPVLMPLGALPSSRQAALRPSSKSGPVEGFVLHRVVNFEVSDLDTVHGVIYVRNDENSLPPLRTHKMCGEVAGRPARVPGSRGLPLSRACFAPPSISSPDSPAHACQDGALTPAEARFPGSGTTCA